VLQAIAAGWTKFNLKFNCQNNYEVRFGKWKIRHQSSNENLAGGDRHWKLWITCNGRKFEPSNWTLVFSEKAVSFTASGEDINSVDGRRYKLVENLRSDVHGKVQFSRFGCDSVRWNITISKSRCKNLKRKHCEL